MRVATTTLLPTTVGIASAQHAVVLPDEPRAGHGEAPRPYLVTAGTAWPQALAVVAPAPCGPVLPEVDEVDERLGALAADEAGRVPLPCVAGPVRVHHGAVRRHRLLAGLAVLQERARVTLPPHGTRHKETRGACCPQWLIFLGSALWHFFNASFLIRQPVRSSARQNNTCNLRACPQCFLLPSGLKGPSVFLLGVP